MKNCVDELLVVLSFLLSLNIVNTELPPFLQICHRYDPYLNDCIRESIEILTPRLSSGIPELYIPPIEPLDIPQVKIDQNSGPIFIHSTYNNIYVHGLSHFKIRNVYFDVNRNKFKLKILFPHILLEANYDMKGKVMMMPLFGHGACQGNFSNVEVTAFVKLERYTKNRAVHVGIKDVIVKYNIGKSNVHLDNLFNGDKVLGATMNTFLNENWDSIASEIEPLVQDAMSHTLYRASEKLFEMFSLDELLPE